jgi:sodium transport system permease protein
VNTVGVLIAKEIRDNLRDRRSLFFALLYGPLLLPVLIIAPMLYSIDRYSIDVDAPTEIAVAGGSQAPGLLQYLRRHNLDATDAPAPYYELLRRSELSVVLSIPEDYAERFTQGRPAPLNIHYNSADNTSDNRRRQLRSALENYAAQIRAQRFGSRGIDASVFQPLAINEHDLSDRRSDLLTVAYLIPFLLLFSMLMGGYYLAVDTTAGERERMSLEPLLSLPLRREQIVLGKYLAILFFVLVALLLPLVSTFALFSLLPSDALDQNLDLGPTTFLVAFLSHLPAALLISAFMMAVAAYTRNTKEAQTHLSVVMLLPILPFFALQYLSVAPTTLTMMIPLLSQFHIMELAVMGECIPPAWLALSGGSCVLLAAVLLLMAVRLYQRERILA